MSFNVLPPIALLARSQGAASLGEAAELMLVGMSIVFGVLIIIWIMLERISWAISSTPPPAVATPAAPAAPPVPAPAPEPIEDPDALDARTLVILTAAITAAVQRPFRITRIQTVADAGASSVWAEHGRAKLVSSHRLRKG
jgi:Na+-transporting methylmalonyl-CoA/oxaloacetate decarboxylase gamma subunit